MHVHNPVAFLNTVMPRTWWPLQQHVTMGVCTTRVFTHDDAKDLVASPTIRHSVDVCVCVCVYLLGGRQRPYI